jgi:ribosomal protein S14
MKKLARKDKKKRLNNFKFELKSKILKSLTKNFNLTNNTRWNASLILTDLPIKLNKISLNNRCILTFRRSSFKQLYSISRLVFLKLARENRISGLKKNIW